MDPQMRVKVEEAFSSMIQHGIFIGHPERIGNVGEFIADRESDSGVSLPDALYYEDFSKREGQIPVENLRYFGRREDGYAFFGYVMPNMPAGEALVLAGCRMFTLDEARAHWYPEPRTSERRQRRDRQALDFVNQIEAWAATFKPEEPKITGIPTFTPPPPVVPRVDLCDVYQFLGPVTSTMFANWMRYVKSTPIPHPEDL